MAFNEFAVSTEIGARAQRWSDALLFGPGLGDFSAPFGLQYDINGVALLRRAGRDIILILTPGKYDDIPLREVELPDPDLFPRIVTGLTQALPDEPYKDVKVLQLPNIVLGLAAGTKITGSLAGTVGPRATWGNSYQGFLTAGHVAHGVTDIKDRWGKTIVGKTQAVLYPGAKTTGTPPNVDIALVSATTAMTSFTQGSSITRGSSVAIDLHLNAGKANDTVIGMIGWYLFPGHGNYIDVYMTSARCTNPGDSGAAVTEAGTTKAIGMVIGGTSGAFTSFVQDLGRQLSALKGFAGLGTLSL